MIVAVIAMRMMQAAINKIINVIAVRDCLVAALRPMLVLFSGDGTADVRVLRRNRDDMFVHMVAMRVVEMAVVEVIDVAVMLDGGMAAGRAVFVGVVFVGLACFHDLYSFCLLNGGGCAAAQHAAAT